MPDSVVTVCPTCQSSLDADALICSRCRTVVHDDYLAIATPLLLPGTPGLSPDPVATARTARLVRLVAWSVLVTSVGATIGFAVAGESAVEPPRLASAAMPAAIKASLPAALPAALPQMFTDSIAPLVLANPPATSVAAPAPSPAVPSSSVVDSSSARIRSGALATRTRSADSTARPAAMLERASSTAATSAPAPTAPVAAAPIVTPIPVARSIAVVEPTAAADARPSPPSLSNEAPMTARPDDGDVRAAVDRFVGSLRSVSGTSYDLGEFFGDGEEHRVTLVRAPATVRETVRSVRVSFELRLAKFDAAGRQFTRLLPVSLDVTRNDGAVSTAAVEFGSLRKP